MSTEPSVEEPIDQEQGTVVTLDKIRPLDAINVSDFMHRLSRKFAIFSDDFKVRVVKAGSGEESIITKFDIPTQFRFPEDGWNIEYVEIPNFGRKEIRYWIGFTQGTIKEDAVKGIGVVANGKSVQEPFEFKLSGGMEGQFGLQYMTGEVVADWL